MGDVSITLWCEFIKSPNRNVSVQLRTENKSLFDFITAITFTSKKRIMLPIAATRETFSQKVILDIGFVGSNKNIADILTKEMNQSKVKKVLNNGCIPVEPEQRVLCCGNDSEWWRSGAEVMWNFRRLLRLQSSCISSLIQKHGQNYEITRDRCNRCLLRGIKLMIEKIKME